MPGGRNAQIARAFAVLQAIDRAMPNGVTVRELTRIVQEHGLDNKERNVRRDIELLELAGFPLLEERHATDTGASLWKLDGWTRVSKFLVLSATELFALYLARGTLSALRNTEFYPDLEAIFNKIESALGKKGPAARVEFSKELYFEPGAGWGMDIDPDLLETVRSCCAEKHVLKVTYASAHSGEERERKLGPHFLYFANKSLYLVAEDLEEKKLKIYGLPRMSNAEPLPEEAYDGAPVDPEQYFTGVFGIFKNDAEPSDIRIQFSKKIAPYVKERRWHPSQRIKNHGEGHIIFTANIAVTPELLNWVMSFGSHAKVLGPKELEEQVKEQAEKMLKLYKKKAA